MSDFQRLLTYLRPHWPAFVLALVCMVVVAAFESAIGALLVPIFNQFLPATSGSSSTLFNLQAWIPSDDWPRAWMVISGMLVGFTLIKGIAEYFSSYLMSRIGQSAVLELRNELYSHLITQGATFFERHRSNFLVSRLVNSCAAIELAVSSHLRDVLRETVMLIFFLGAAFYFNWRLMLGALLIGPVIALLTARFSKALRSLAEEAFDGNKVLTDTAQEALANHTIVRAYQAEKRELRRFSKIAQRIAKANLRSGRIAATSPPTIELIGIVSMVVLFFFGLREINSGNMDAAQFFTFLFFLFRSYDPMRKISRTHNEIVKAFAAAKDVWDVLDEDDRLPETTNAVSLRPLETSISLRDVGFAYQNSDRAILSGVTLDIPKGEVVALVGESGGGKSTLIKLIQRIYDPSEGRILWDGIPLQSASTESLRRQIALVTQETVLFNDTVAYNISYGNPDASIEEIQEAARVAFADEFIGMLPNGYETVVGERGVFLSGGQRQRIAIARAVLTKAPVLILDEATSALDAESERFVQKALENLMKDKTSVVIAHRLSTIRRADQIVVMEKGRIIERGTHAQLMETSGVYKRLYELQFADPNESVPPDRR